MKKLGNCLSCNKEIELYRTHYKDGVAQYRKFCNTSCSAKVNNVKYPKRSLEGICSKCSTPIELSRTFCKGCRPKYYIAEKTLQEITSRANYQRNAQIRSHARDMMKRSGQPKICRVCGYNKHESVLEVSHVKPINTFPETALVLEVNAITNLEYLCPTHHSEHEKGLLSSLHPAARADLVSKQNPN